MSILITGGTGFVGINLVHHYAARGIGVTSLDLDLPDAVTRQFVSNLSAPVTFVCGDVRDADILTALVKSHEIEYVIHAAAITPDVERERQNAFDIMDVNLMATIRILDLARMSPHIKRTLVISSAAVYGVKPEDIPLREQDPVAPGNLYAISKYGSELLVDRYIAL
ncbi:MAG: NAD-dependent epimerase/dehydratase family protein, partial [bacterium]